MKAPFSSNVFQKEIPSPTGIHVAREQMLWTLQGHCAEDCRPGESRDGAMVPNARNVEEGEGRDGRTAGIT